MPKHFFTIDRINRLLQRHRRDRLMPHALNSLARFNGLSAHVIMDELDRAMNCDTSGAPHGFKMPVGARLRLHEIILEMGNG